MQGQQLSLKQPPAELLPAQGSVWGWGRSVFVLLRPSTNWIRPTHVTDGNLLSSESADLNVRAC